MSDEVWVELQPRGERLRLKRGTPLQDVLFEHGVEFPCGGRHACKGCRVRVIRGTVPIDDRQRSVLSARELAAGWRLACCSQADGDLTLDIGQWEETILADNSAFAFTPREGLGVALDVGTTTLVAQLLDRRTGQVRAVGTALNPQAVHGADIMSRVHFGVEPAGREKLCHLIRRAVSDLLRDVLASGGAAADEVRRVAIVGNTVMHHLFCGLDIAALSVAPFETRHGGLQRLAARDLGWPLGDGVCVEFLPTLGSFVGSDILAGILATRMHESDALLGLVDLGTNGEIVIGNRRRILCASTAAGPAFEGARISMGMRAATGAISEVRVQDRTFACHVLGNAPPRGICGSGLVDAVAAGLDLGMIQASGRLTPPYREFVLAEPVRLTQADVREMQVAKAAIPAGLSLLLAQWGTTAKKLSALYIAGAFGNTINLDSARRIGLIHGLAHKVHVAGNTALLGAKLALFADDGEPAEYHDIRRLVEHVPLAADPRFVAAYVQAMRFPPPA